MHLIAGGIACGIGALLVLRRRSQQQVLQMQEAAGAGREGTEGGGREREMIALG